MCLPRKAINYFHHTTITILPNFAEGETVIRVKKRHSCVETSCVLVTDDLSLLGDFEHE